MLLASLAPTLSKTLFSPQQAAHNAIHAHHAMAHADHSEHGHHSESSEEASSRPMNEKHHVPGDHTEHCPYCRIQYDLPVLPSVLNSLAKSISTQTAFPRLFYLSPRPLFMWAKAQPRAPPLFS